MITKITLFFSLLINTSSIVLAQWNPSTYTNAQSIYTTSFLSKDSFIISMNGRLFLTKNAGEVFDSFPSFPSQSVHNLVYKSKDTIYVARELTKGLLCSYDAGNTWFTQTLLMPNGDTAFKTGKICFLGFFDKNRGIVFGDTVKGIQQVFLTEDGGQHWHFYTHSSIVQSIKFSISQRSSTFNNKYIFENGTGKFLLGSGYKLLTLKNFGKEWHIDTLLPSDRRYHSIAFMDEQIGIARISIPTIGTLLFETIDGGNSWSEIADTAKLSNGTLLYVKPTAKYPGFYIASTLQSKGESNVSFDNGHTWQLFDTLNHGNGTVFFRDAETGVCTETSFSGSPIYYYKPLNTGIRYVNKKDQWKLEVFPNPAQTFVSFSQTFPSVQLWDLQGKLVATDVNTNQLDISYVSNGLYILKVINENQIPATQKLVIQH